MNSIASLRGNVRVAFVFAVAICGGLGLTAWTLRPAHVPVHAQNLQPPSACEAAVPNPLAVSTFRWYSRNQVAQFPTGQSAAGISLLSIVFDGSNMNVLAFSPQSNSSTSAVIFKIRAADGALLATFTDFPSLEFARFGSML